VNILNKYGETPLHYAARLGRKDLVHALVAKGANIMLKGLRDKETAYELAVRWKYDEMASHLKKIHDLFDWLKAIDMENCLTLFVNEEMFLEECESIDEGILDRLHITTTGQRLKILKASKELSKLFLLISPSTYNYNSLFLFINNRVKKISEFNSHKTERRNSY
jgi:ankyrin repeat protein